MTVSPLMKGAGMINGGSIYIITRDFEKCLDFYRKLLERDVVSQNATRFAVFALDGLVLAVMNGSFDEEHPDMVESRGEYDPVYDDYRRILSADNCGKVVLNLGTDYLRAEHERVRSLGIGSHLTEIRYVKQAAPYWYFLLKDPDGNTIEITGKYAE